MKTVLQVLPVTGMAMLLLAGCQTQQSPTAQPVTQTAPTRATPTTPAVVDPINDPSLRDNNNDSGGGGGNDSGGGGNDSPGGGGGGSWG